MAENTTESAPAAQIPEPKEKSKSFPNARQLAPIVGGKRAGNESEKKENNDIANNNEMQQQSSNLAADNRSSRRSIRKRVKDFVPTKLPGGIALPDNLHDFSGNIASLSGNLTKLPDDFLSTLSTMHKSKEERERELEKLEEETPEKCYKLRFPQPLRPAEPGQLVQGLQLNALKYLVLAAFACYICGRLHFGYFFGVLAILGGGLAYYVLGTETQQGLDWQLEKMEGSKTLYDTSGETVEWLNQFLQQIWRSIDPSLFVTVEDILEDTLESLAPAMINAVKVTDFDIGIHAPRIQMIRIFPPMPGQPEEAIFGEVTFSFHAQPVASLSSSRNVSSAPPGIAIRFKTGLKAPIDVKAELTQLSGKMRFKILTAPDMPFVSKVTISFVSVPKISTGVMPLSRHMNLMKLPMMKSLVNEAVKLGFAEFVDPKSLTIDVKQIMGAAAMDTSAIGVVKVRVREAFRSDDYNVIQDMQDSYATISLSTQGKTGRSSTRVLTNDTNPRWDEDLYILVRQDDIINNAKVEVKVWDADKIKFDDEWGTASIPVKDIVQGQVDELGNVTNWCKDERVVFDGWASLDGEENVENAKLKLNYQVSFHPKYITAPPQSIMTELDSPKSKKQLRLEQESLSPSHKSGILTVCITEASDLEIGDPEVLAVEEFKHPYSANQIVNPYACVYVNDSKVYETRAKLRNPSPHWNAVTEQFIKEFDTAFLRISVKASLDMERDPVLGTKVFFLSDIFGNQHEKFKEVERWVPLANGIGFGKVLLNLKYKPVKLTLPPELRGSDVGTMVIDRITFTGLQSPFSSDYTSSTKANLALNMDPVILKRVKARDLAQDGPDITWAKRKMYFPLTMRYHTALYVHVMQGSFASCKATGRLWLKTVQDACWQEAVIGLHDYRPEHSKEANRNEDHWDTAGKYGQVKIRFKIMPGFSPVHTHLRSFRKDMLGADPFHDESLRSKTQQWIKEEEEGLLEQEEEADRRESNITELSEEYGQQDEEVDEEYFHDMREFSKAPHIAKYRVLRKLTWGTDLVRHRIETVRDGFNSEARAYRTVTKE